MNNPLVSVVITTFNRAQYVAKAIDSVLDQTYSNMEIIVLDDCSRDNTPQIITDYSRKDNRIKIFRNEINLGVAKSLNKGVNLAQGVYIAILDDDDSWCNKDKIQKQVAFLENHQDYVLVGGGAIVKDQSDKEIFSYLLPEKDLNIRKHLLVDNCFVHSAVLFRKKDCKTAGNYKEQLKVDWDWELWLRLGKLGKFYNFSEYFVNYLQWNQNISNLNARKNLKTRIYLFYNYRKDYPGAVKSLILGFAIYFYYSLPFKKRLKPFFVKIRNILFKSPIYEE